MKVHLLQAATRRAAVNKSQKQWPEISINIPGVSPSPGPAPPDETSPGPTPPPEIETSLTRANSICVKNQAGFKMAYSLWDTATNMRLPQSSFYAMGNEECMEISSIPQVQANDPIVIVVETQGGYPSSFGAVSYDSIGSGVATVECSGATGGYGCSFEGGQALVQVPNLAEIGAWTEQVYANKICVQNDAWFRLRVKLWDVASDVVGTESEPFDMGGSTCIDGTSLSGIQYGHPMAPIMYPQGGTNLVFRTVLYSEEASAATYRCTGSSVNYDCRVVGE